MLQPVILCGGDGTRLWPASRKALPKQFMPLRGSTLFNQTLQRVSGLENSAAPLVLCNETHRFLAAAQMQEAGMHMGLPGGGKPVSSILLEPAAKNTAPAIALAALHFEREDPVLLVLPADHAISQTEVFAHGVRLGLQAAAQGLLVTFGITPARPETGYGYIHKGEAVGNGAFKVERFVEKPDAERAVAFMESGEYYWNSGMFMFRPSVVLQELAHYAPDILAACRSAYEKRTMDMDFIRPDREAFEGCPAESIDFAVMERTSRCCVVPLDVNWADLGSWHSIYELGPGDTAGNVCEGDVLALDCQDSFLMSQSRLVSAIGLEGMVVVETADAVMVAPKSRSQEVKSLVEELKKKSTQRSRGAPSGVPALGQL